MTDHCIAPHQIQEGDLLAYLEGDASPVVIQHIKNCSACAQEVEALRRMDILFSTAFRVLETSLITAGPPVTFGKFAPARSAPQPVDVQKEQRKSKVGENRPAWPGMALAMTAVLILLGVAYGFNQVIWNNSSQRAEDYAAATLQVTQEIVNSLTIEAENPARTPSGTDQKPVKIAGTTGGVIENPAAIAPPRSLLLLLEDEWSGLIEESTAIMPPRDLLVSLQGELDAQFDYSFIRSPVRTEAYWTETYISTAENNQTYFIWIEEANGFSMVYAAYSAAHSGDKGQTFSESALLSQGVDRAFNPILAVDSEGRLYAVWRTRHHLEIDIFFTRSIDGGQNWSPVVRINDDIRRAFNPSLAVDTRGHLYVAWQNNPGTVTDIFLAQSLDGGQTWSKERRMAN